MIFDKLRKKYLEDAVKLAQVQYNMEQKHIQALYEEDYYETMFNLLSDIFSSQYGLVALERGKVLGYLSFWGDLNNHFGNVLGAFSPLFASAYSGENRNKIASLLFQHVSEKMVKKEILSYAVCVYGHDNEIIKSFAMNGFGFRCTDAIRNVDKPLNIKINKAYSYEEIHYSEASCILHLKNSLEKHMLKSPTYFFREMLSEEKFIDLCNRRKSRFFVVKNKSEIIGYLEIKNYGETFITREEDYLHIVGAYLKQNFRGQNIIQSLLVFVLETLKKDGIKRLGVDCETINPNAFNFWQKYFDSYTYSLVRRIDERIL